MKCVLDPNVHVAALLSRDGTPAALLRAWIDGAFEVVVSPALLDELERVLAYPKIRSRIREDEATAYLRLLREGATLIEDPSPSPSAATQDPDDDEVVALSLEAKAVIVSGDRQLLAMAEDLPVFTPADFRRLLERLDEES